MDLADFYYQAERYLCQENVEAKGVDVNAMDNERPSKKNMENVKESRKRTIISKDRKGWRGNQSFSPTLS